MSLDQSSSALHLSLPPASSSTARTPSVINVHPSVLASILTHHSRRPAAEDGASASSSSNNNTRVMGALMGHRSESGAEVEVRSCFAVPHSENEQQIALDMPFQQAMVKLLSQNGTKEVVVGWYATSAELNPYSALIQNYFSAETAPFPAVHLTVDTALTASGQGLGVKGYVSTTLGLTPKAENCAFLPVEVALKFCDSERAALDLLTAPAPTPSPALPPLPALSASLDQLSSLIDQSLAYVSSQTAAGATPSAKDIEVGRYLLEGVGRWNAVGTEDEGGVREGVQDTLTVTYLSNLVRSQMELGGRLTLLQQAQ